MARRKQGMTATQVKAIVEAHIEKMVRLLGVQAWKIDVLYEEAGQPNWAASCTRQLPYQMATIRIDPAMAKDEADVLESLRHELIHVALAPFDAYRDVVTSSIKPDSSMDAAEERSWTLAIESAVLAVERIFDWGLPQYPIAELCKPKPTKKPRNVGILPQKIQRRDALK